MPGFYHFFISTAAGAAVWFRLWFCRGLPQLINSRRFPPGQNNPIKIVPGYACALCPRCLRAASLPSHGIVSASDRHAFMVPQIMVRTLLPPVLFRAAAKGVRTCWQTIICPSVCMFCTMFAPSPLLFACRVLYCWQVDGISGRAPVQFGQICRNNFCPARGRKLRTFVALTQKYVKQLLPRKGTETSTVFPRHRILSGNNFCPARGRKLPLFFHAIEFSVETTFAPQGDAPAPQSKSRTALSC